MPTQGQRQNYMWRPNDYSSTTRLRYDMEVNHWLESIKSAQAKTQRSTSSLPFIGLLLGLVINLISVVVLSLTYLFQWIIRRVDNRTVELTYRDYTQEEVEEINRTVPHIDIYEDL